MLAIHDALRYLKSARRTLERDRLSGSTSAKDDEEVVDRAIKTVESIKHGTRGHLKTASFHLRGLADNATDFMVKREILEAALDLAMTDEVERDL